MTLKGYFLKDSFDACRALDYLANAIPCFVSTIKMYRGSIYVEIECRNEDVPTIERVLAPYV